MRGLSWITGKKGSGRAASTTPFHARRRTDVLNGAGGNIDPGNQTRVATAQQIKAEEAERETLQHESRFNHSSIRKVRKVTLSRFSWDTVGVDTRPTAREVIVNSLRYEDTVTPFNLGAIMLVTGLKKHPCMVALIELTKDNVLWMTPKCSRKGTLQTWLWNKEGKERPNLEQDMLKAIDSFPYDLFSLHDILREAGRNGFGGYREAELMTKFTLDGRIKVAAHSPVRWTRVKK